MHSGPNEFAANESCEETLRLRVAVKRNFVISSCTLGIQTPLQLTTYNLQLAMGASCDLFDVSMEVQNGKFTSGNVGHTTKYCFPWLKGNFPH